MGSIVQNWKVFDFWKLYEVNHLKYLYSSCQIREMGCSYESMSIIIFPWIVGSVLNIFCVLHFWLCHKQVLLKYITRRFCPESETDFLNWIADEYMNPTCISGTISPKYKVVFMFSLVTIPSMKCHVWFFVPGNQVTRMQGCDSLGSIMTLIWQFTERFAAYCGASRSCLRLKEWILYRVCVDTSRSGRRLAARLDD